LQLSRTLPSHVPPQVEPSESHEGRTPRGEPVTGVHAPSLPPTLHASHWPLQLVLQQKPSTQVPEVH